MVTELTHAKSQTRSISDFANASVEKLSTRLCSATAGCSRKPESLPSLTSTYFLSGSSVPYLSSNLWYEGKSEQVQERPRSTNTLSSIPRHIVDIMLKHYCEIYRPQYPAIEESDLYKACDRVYSNTRPSDFDLFCVHVILAISVRPHTSHYARI